MRLLRLGLVVGRRSLAVVAQQLAHRVGVEAVRLDHPAKVGLRPQVALEEELALLDARRRHIGKEVPRVDAAHHRPLVLGLLQLILVVLRLRVAVAGPVERHPPSRGSSR
jgi:hypothetical protein